MIRLKMPTPSMEYIQKCGDEQNLSMNKMARFFMLDLAGRVEHMGGRFLYKDIEVTPQGIHATVNVSRLPSLHCLVDGYDLPIARFAAHIMQEIKIANDVLGDELYPLATCISDVFTPSESWPTGWIELYIESVAWFYRININAETGEEHLGGGIEDSMTYYHLMDVEQLDFADKEEKRALIHRHKIDKTIDDLLAENECRIMQLIENAKGMKPFQVEYQRKAIRDIIKDDLALLIGDTIESIRTDDDWFKKDEQIVRDIDAKNAAKLSPHPPSNPKR